MGFPTMTQLVRSRAVRIRDQMETELHLRVWDLEGCSSSRRDFPAHRAVYTVPVVVQLPASTYPLLIMGI